MIPSVEIFQIPSTELITVSWTLSLRLMSSCPSFNRVVFCLQVVYSPSARELKMETVKAETPEKEEDDIDIDAI